MRFAHHVDDRPSGKQARVLGQSVGLQIPCIPLQDLLGAVTLVPTEDTAPSHSHISQLRCRNIAYLVPLIL